PSDVDGGIIYIPTGATSGRVVVNRGSAFPLFRFDGVSGQFAINGDADGTGAGDVLAVYGVSTTGLQSGIGETTAANGADTIAVSDQGVSIANASLGTLRSVSFAQTNGQPTFATVYVRTGNESGPTGDTVTATPTNQFNLIVDGMGPVGATPGNRISVAASGPTTRFRVSDPSLGPPHTV